MPEVFLSRPEVLLRQTSNWQAVSRRISPGSEVCIELLAGRLDVGLVF